jgi:hypothetical protein
LPERRTSWGLYTNSEEISEGKQRKRKKRKKQTGIIEAVDEL